MLGLETERLPLAILTPSLSNMVVQVVAGVELHTRLGGEDLHHPPAARLEHLGGKRGFRAAAIENEVVIIADF